MEKVCKQFKFSIPIAGADLVHRAVHAGIASQGTRAIVQAIQATSVRRIVVVNAAPITIVPSPGRPKPPKHDPGDGFVMRYLLGPLTKAALRKLYADLALMEDIMRASGLDWTVFLMDNRTGPQQTRISPTMETFTRWIGGTGRGQAFGHVLIRTLALPQLRRLTSDANPLREESELSLEQAVFVRPVTTPLNQAAPRHLATLGATVDLPTPDGPPISSTNQSASARDVISRILNKPPPPGA